MSNRRNIFLINRKFQIRFSIYVCSFVLVMSVVYPWTVYYIFEGFLSYKDQLPASLVYKFQTVREAVFWRIIIIQGLFVGLTFLLSLYLSHKIAGPIYKMIQFFNEAKTGKLNPYLTFRKQDHFFELAEAYNEMMNGIKSRIDENLEVISTTIARLETQAEKMSETDKAEIEKSISELREVKEQLTP